MQVAILGDGTDGACGTGGWQAEAEARAEAKAEATVRAALD